MNEDFNYGIKVILKEPDDFLLIKESLTRMGVASNKTKTLFQSCHILHRRGEYYIMHFKEMFKLDGRPSNIDVEDYQRRNLVAHLLEDWGLLTVIEPDKYIDKANMNAIKVLSYSDKNEWSLCQKYTIGKKGNFK